MIYFDVRLENGARSTTVSIRRMGSKDPSTLDVYAYEINLEGKRCRGTVNHSGPEDFTLITSVLSDYTRMYGR